MSERATLSVLGALVLISALGMWRIWARDDDQYEPSMRVFGLSLAGLLAVVGLVMIAAAAAEFVI
ncbi:hypothetical protein [Aeromicrobium sp. Root495]|uniref:hypothetical protein n=1 Tax=Aeromicrobium sp. Root495 TaxID=1736550 RepID=UPI0012E809A9|nr:hypothetical protein [Aeromicrobium sp. Root495]